MSKITKRDTPPRDVGSVDDRLGRLLDSPSLAHVVPHLPPETLHQLIRYRGLDACAELVTAATPAQLTALLDLDLWRAHDEFDVDRFGDWLEVLADIDHSVAARTVAALDKDLVIVGLSRYVRVFDPGIFEPIAQSDDEPTDRDEAMREGDSMRAGDAATQISSGECEVAGYIVRARRADRWDAIVTLLVALDAEHGNYFHAVMRGCRRLSNSRPEIDGLDDLLPAPEQHLHEVALAREGRRSQQGYATPADARAFLEMARRPKYPGSAAAVQGTIMVDPIVSAYFRAADAESHETARSAEPKPKQSSGVHARDADVAESLEAVVELLNEAGVMPERPRALLEAADAGPQAARLTRLRPLMSYVSDTDETVYLTRNRELAFLGNTLLAGCSVQSRPFTTQEAFEAASAICNLGLEYWPARWPGMISPGAPDTFPPESLLIEHGLVTAFEVGWSALHQDVSLFAADRLIATLTDLNCVDHDIRSGLVTLRHTLAEQRAAGTPWRARDAAEVLAMLDMTAWISVLGLLDECPVLPAALTAVLTGRVTRVSPTAFDFISTAAQIGDVRLFLRKLPEVLSR